MGKPGIWALFDLYSKSTANWDASTILGGIPLLLDVFFVSMSITIMAGPGFATVLTLIFVPTLYSLLFGIKAR